MSSSQPRDRRPSDEPPPYPKKRKTVTLPLRTGDRSSNSGAQLGPHNHGHGQGPLNPDKYKRQEQEWMAFRNPVTPVRGGASRTPAIPARLPGPTPQGRTGRGTPLASASRMIATPARSQVRTVQEHVNHPSPEVSRFLPTKTDDRSGSQRKGSVVPVMSARRVSVAPRKTTSNTQQRATNSYAGTAAYFSDSEQSSDDNFQISKLIISSGSSQQPSRRYGAARKTGMRLAIKSASRNVPGPSRSDRELVQKADSAQLQDADDEEDDLYVDSDPTELLHRAQRIRDGDSDHEASYSSLENGSKDTPEDPERELCEVLGSLTLREYRLRERGRLPFLRRNIRKSIEALGPEQRQGHDPHIVPSEGITKVIVVFVMGDYQSFGGSFYDGWICPICRIAMTFDTRAGLDIHIYRYHTECEFEWSEGDDNSLLLTITLPEIPLTDTESDESDFSSMSDSEGTDAELQATNDILNRSLPPEEKPFLRGSSVVRAQTSFTGSPVKVQPVSPQLRPFRPGIGPSVTPEVLRPPRPIDPEDLERYPTPPPLTDLEGPAAVYPYIRDDAYSARPGGPRLYDILNELSLEPFGNMAWYIIDREEDVFELDNVRDEDKVMMALWARWIFLNRTKFLANYKKGAQLFIDEYWRYIHRAAGFSALRGWLLVFVQNRYLTGPEFCDLLKYYTDLVGMDYWK